MADIFSNLYLALSVQYYHDLYGTSEQLTQYIIDQLWNENQFKINNIIHNLGGVGFLLTHLKRNTSSRDYDNEYNVFMEIMNNEDIMNEIKKNIYYKNTIIEDMELLNQSDGEFIYNNERIKNNIINVEEFEMLCKNDT